jgi:hypothetical protein
MRILLAKKQFYLLFQSNLFFIVLTSSCEIPDTPVLTNPGSIYSPVNTQIDTSLIWQEIAALKASQSIDMACADDVVIEKYKNLLSKYYEKDLDANSATVDTVLSGKPYLAESLFPSQIAAWRKLDSDSKNTLELSWSKTALSPERIAASLRIKGNNAEEAMNSFIDQYQGLIKELYGIGPSDEILLAKSQYYTNSISIEGYRISYLHSTNGLPVYSDWLSLYIRTSDYCPAEWDIFIFSNWSRDAMLVDPNPILSKEDVLKILFGADTVDVDTEVMNKMNLGVLPGKESMDLVYQVPAILNDSMKMFYVSAITGRIVDETPMDIGFSGSVNIYAGKPHDGTVKSPRPLRNVNIYESVLSYSGDLGCWQPQSSQQYRGASKIGTTDHSGCYSGLFASDPQNDNWFVDYSGFRAWDVGKQYDLVSEFVAGEATTFVQETVMGRARRGEIYYLLDASIEYYEQLGFNLGGPLGFSYDNYNWKDCQPPVAPVDAYGCCLGKAYAPGYCINISCGYNFDAVAEVSVEQHFRFVVLHELNHMISLNERGTWSYLCSGDANNDGPETALWEEGRADAGAMASGNFERSRPFYRPDLKYTEDFSCGNYQGGSIWTSIFTEYILKAGYNAAGKDIYSLMQSYDENSRMVGSCFDRNGDRYVDINECLPTNSTYRLLLDANAINNTSKQYRKEEISSIFKAHVTDADRATAGNQSFPWADEMPNHYRGAPFVPVENGLGVLITQGPHSEAGALKLGYGADHDTVTFHGKAGIEYLVETTGLGLGMDTYLEILNADGEVIASNDDCGENPRSCIVFTPSVCMYYKARVRPVRGSTTGRLAIYGIKITPQSDDYGNTIDASTAMIANGAFRNATFSSANDYDVYKIASTHENSVGYIGCSEQGVPVKVEVLNSIGVVVDSYINTSCTSGFRWYNIGKGVYFFRAMSNNGNTGSYKIKAIYLEEFDIDGNGLAGNAWDLEDDVARGTMLGAKFETTGDKDWYRIYADQPCRSFTITTWGLSDNVDTEIEIYAPESTLFGRTGTIDSLPNTSGSSNLGHWMLKDDDGGITARGSSLTFTAPVAGYYYVWVKNKGTAAGDYYLAWEKASTISSECPMFP